MAVDRADVFGMAFGLKVVPVTFLVDEVGILRLRGAGPDAELLKQIEVVLKEPLSTVRAVATPLPAARPKGELEEAVAADPSDWKSRVALAGIYDAERRFPEATQQLEAAARLQPASPEIPFAWGMILLHQDHPTAALEKLRTARRLDPENWLIRKQIWAIEHPEKFYSAESPDFDWQKQERARERAAGD